MLDAQPLASTNVGSPKRVISGDFNFSPKFASLTSLILSTREILKPSRAPMKRSAGVDNGKKGAKRQKASSMNGM